MYVCIGPQLFTCSQVSVLKAKVWTRAWKHSDKHVISAPNCQGPYSSVVQLGRCLRWLSLDSSRGLAIEVDAVDTHIKSFRVCELL